jgi:uroporphyrinogen-III decarboxylase
VCCFGKPLIVLLNNFKITLNQPCNRPVIALITANISQTLATAICGVSSSFLADNFKVKMKSQRKQLNQLLLKSVIMRDINQAKLLIEQGADVNTRDSEHNETPLILAVKFADAAMVRLLLKAGAELIRRMTRGKQLYFTLLFFQMSFSFWFHLDQIFKSRIDKETAF